VTIWGKDSSGGSTILVQTDQLKLVLTYGRIGTEVEKARFEVAEREGSYAN